MVLTLLRNRFSYIKQSDNIAGKAKFEMISKGTYLYGYIVRAVGITCVLGFLGAKWIG